MIKKYETNIILLLLAGFILFIITVNIKTISDFESSKILNYLRLFSLSLMCLGCMYLAKSKGYHGAWGFLGLIWVIGPIIIAFFPDKYKDHQIQVKLETIKELIEINESYSDENLAVLLNDENQDVTAEVIKELLKSRDKRGTEFIVSGLEKPDFRDQLFDFLLEKVGMNKLDAKTRRLVYVNILKHGSYEADRMKSAQELSKQKNPQTVDALTDALNDGSDPVRNAVVESLGKIGDTRAVNPLINILQEDNTLYVRISAAISLGKLEDKRAIAPLINVLKNIKNLGMQARATIALVKLGDSRGMEIIIKNLKSNNEDRQFAALTALDEIADKKTSKLLINSIENKKFHWRSEAVEILGKIKNTNSIEPLIYLLKDKDEYVRKAAAKALRKITGKSFRSNYNNWLKWWRYNKRKMT